MYVVVILTRAQYSRCYTTEGSPIVFNRKDSSTAGYRAIMTQKNFHLSTVACPRPNSSQRWLPSRHSTTFRRRFDKKMAALTDPAPTDGKKTFSLPFQFYSCLITYFKLRFYWMSLNIYDPCFYFCLSRIFIQKQIVDTSARSVYICHGTENIPFPPPVLRC